MNELGVNLANYLRIVALSAPHRPALMMGETIISYGEFERQVAQLASSLHTRHHLRPGNTVAMAMENSLEFFIVMFGIWRAGLAAVPINSKLHPKEFSWIFEHSNSKLVFATPSLSDTLIPNIPIIVTGTPDYQNLFSDDEITEAVSTPNDPAWIFYTSGTTGRPKGAILTHENLLFASNAYYADVDFIGPKDIRLHAAPLSHGSGLYGLPHILKGAQNRIIEGGMNAGEIYHRLAKEKNVSFFAAPTMVTRLMAAGEAGGDTSGLKTIEYGGAPMYVADLKRALQHFGPHLYQLYGQGESPMTITNLTKAQHINDGVADYDVRLGSAGFARTGVEVAIADEYGTRLTVGETGEIITRSPCVMKGYLNNDEATNKALRDGWLFTGDVGMMDERGMLTLKDRSKDMIISGGSNIYPREIEEVLLTNPLVREVAVIGTPHQDWGEEVIAFVVGEGCSADDLDRLCLDNLARFKRPKRYEFVDELPKNNYGKILKRELRERS